MFCQNCGKELEENWTVCPYCGNRILSEGKETENEIKKGGEDGDEDIKILKALIREHPVRSILCIPAVIYMLYLIYQLITTDLSRLTIWIFLKFCIRSTYCTTALWLLYGPVNLKEVKEKVNKKPQKGYGIAYHVGGAIFVSVILVAGNYIMDVSNEEETAPDQIAANESTDSETGSSMSMEEYLNQCQEVTVEELARNPEQYIGKNIMIEGGFSILADEITIGWFPENYIIKVNYDNKQVVDTQGNVVGNIMSGDHGLVAGRYGGEDIVGHPYIDAEIIILDNGQDGIEDSAERESKEENTSEEDVSTEDEPETMEMEYIFPDSDSRYLSEDELINLDSDALKLARNEIFARHGYIFKDKGLQEYFNSTTWYKGTVKGEDFNMEKEFNDFEKENVALIGSIEELVSE